jgi:hypothetical protein
MLCVSGFEVTPIVAPLPTMTGSSNEVLGTEREEGDA